MRKSRAHAAPQIDSRITDTLKDCLSLFQKDHALDRFNWGASALRAQDIRELNELPGKIREAIGIAEGRAR